jgi:hypothetical protein
VRSSYCPPQFDEIKEEAIPDFPGTPIRPAKVADRHFKGRRCDFFDTLVDEKSGHVPQAAQPLQKSSPSAGGRWGCAMT